MVAWKKLTCLCLGGMVFQLRRGEQAAGVTQQPQEPRGRKTKAPLCSCSISWPLYDDTQLAGARFLDMDEFCYGNHFPTFAYLV